jgi:hypothetical protein
MATIYNNACCCSNFSTFSQTNKTKTFHNNIVFWFNCNNLQHIAVDGEILYSNLTFTPHPFRIHNCFNSNTNNQFAALSGFYRCSGNRYNGICIINKLKTTDIIFPFHYFW